ncbi:urea ABC transporter permease subunit UrtC [Candidatus Poribacteria bacterium]|nr:urea ABC transporter permease subunit UrtC [Candidatus Poribacteria bacterium]MEE2909915.1 urea ABC transporter permease subunit UrtC [Candidatus Poribacteria bacterium]|tara:strand:- start:155 stop:1387 length:1233 start_codon:yes stop_codon:yes gene_type:complete
MINQDRLKRNLPLISWLFVGIVIIPILYLLGIIPIGTVNKLGRYLTFALVAIGLDLIWGYAGILSLCQALFFCLGGYAIGMYLAHHGGPEGIIDKTGWKLPACLFVVYPYKVGEAPGDAMVPWFWKPFWSLPATVFLGLFIPGLVAFIIGYFGFRSRVRGVYFAILTQAITVAAQNFFTMNNMKFCGTNGLTRFDRICLVGHEHGVDVCQKVNLSFQLSSDSLQFSLYLLTTISIFGTYVLYRYVISSRLGRILVAIRDAESTLRFSGYKPYKYKLFAFVLAAMTAALGGLLYVPQMKIITPYNMGAERSILIVIFVAVGGRNTLSGALVGALTVNLLYDFLTSFNQPIPLTDLIFPGGLTFAKTWPIVLGLMFLTVVLGYPDGLVKLPSHFWSNIKNKSDLTDKQKTIG